MTAAEFEVVGRVLFGDNWRQTMAEKLGVSLRNVQFWAAEPPARCKEIPAGVDRELIELTRCALTTDWGRDRAARIRLQADFLARLSAATISET